MRALSGAGLLAAQGSHSAGVAQLVERYLAKV